MASTLLRRWNAEVASYSIHLICVCVMLCKFKPGGWPIINNYYEISVHKHSESLRKNVAGPHWALAPYGQIFADIS